jgi:hypothetical protein
MEPFSRISLPLHAVQSQMQGLHYASNWALNQQGAGGLAIIPILHFGGSGAHPYMNSQHMVAQQAGQGTGTVTVPYRVSFPCQRAFLLPQPPSLSSLAPCLLNQQKSALTRGMCPICCRRSADARLAPKVCDALTLQGCALLGLGLVVSFHFSAYSCNMNTDLVPRAKRRPGKAPTAEAEEGGPASEKSSAKGLSKDAASCVAVKASGTLRRRLREPYLELLMTVQVQPPLSGPARLR